MVGGGDQVSQLLVTFGLVARWHDICYRSSLDAELWL